MPSWSTFTCGTRSSTMPRLQSARLIAPISLAPGAAVSLLYLVFKFNLNYFHKSDKSSTSPRRAYKWSQPGGYCRTEDPSKRKSDFKNIFLDLLKVYKLNKKDVSIRNSNGLGLPRTSWKSLLTHVSEAGQVESLFGDGQGVIVSFKWVNLPVQNQ